MTKVSFTAFDPMTTQETPFQAGLKNQIRKFIRTAKQDGAVSMSVDNLIQCVRPPSSGIDGAPLGTNAAYYYRQMFREICQQDAKIASFIL